MIGKTLGHYRVGEQLGRGGMGEVYLADDLNLNRKVALKFLPDAFAADPERMARFEREAKLLASLNHPNIAAIYGLEQPEGKRFLVLELVEGETLAQRLSKGALPIEEALGVCRQIAEALEAAHEKGVIHRDLKPANVMITEGDKVKILDFGLAKALADETQSIDSSQSPTLTEAMTRPGVILGTAAYMSPEQAKGKSVDKRADIWAFGCILYECLTGKRAFEGETVTETLAAVLTREPEWEKVPAKVQPLLCRCLERDPRKRLRDIGEAMAWIESAPQSAPAKSSWVAWSIAALFLLATAILSLILIREKPSAAEPMRLEINLRDNVTFGPVGFMYLSPDGRKLAFIGTSQDGKTCLWLRALDTLQARALLGTESNVGLSFFWSHDSRFIAFQAGGKLKKIDVAGGPPQTICDLPALVTGGSWNINDVIIFADYQGSNGIMRVAAGGGNPSPVTKPDPARKEVNHILPLFLPDGRHFLYFCNSAIPENQGIYIGSLDARPEEQGGRRLVSTSWSGAAYIPSPNSGPGELLFMREQALVAQQFDDKRLELIGEALPVAEHIAYFINTGLFSASANDVLVYKTGGALIQLSQPTWFDRQGKNLGVMGERGSYYGLALRPDGSRAVISWLSLSQAKASVDLWLHDFTRGTNTQFTFGQGENNMSPIFSPDGSHIVFASNRDGGVYNLYQKPVSGARGEEQILKSSEDKFPTSLSNDGRLVMFTARDLKKKYHLWVLPLEGDRMPMPFLRTEFNEFDGYFSPDSRWVAYVSDESGSNEIYVRAFLPENGAASSEAGSKWRISKEGGTAPRWSRDGKELYYRAIDGMVMVVDIAPGTVFSTGNPRSVFQAPAVFQMGGESFVFLQWDIASDGKRFLLVAPAVENSPTSLTVVLNWMALLKK